jgi:hypothetical protein
LEDRVWIAIYAVLKLIAGVIEEWRSLATVENQAEEAPDEPVPPRQHAR